MSDFLSVVDLEREEARSAARDALGPWPEMTRREAEADEYERDDCE